MKKLLIGVSVLLFTFGAVADTWTDPATGIKWRYTVKNGEATVGDDENWALAVPKSTSGAIAIPSMFGGCPVTRIGEAAFNCCGGLTRVTIPSSVTSIGDGAFDCCDGLTSVTIPSSVTSIGEGAFFECTALKSITIPSSVTSIGNDPFGHCSGLVEIQVAVGNSHYTSEDGVLFNKSKTEIVAYPAGKSGQHYTIPSGVTSIVDYAFSDCIGLTRVTIPSSVTNIGNWVFSDCGFTSVTIPSSVTCIGRGAFARGGLTSATIPSSVTSIGSGAFVRCEALKTIYVSKGDSNRVSKMIEDSGFDTSKLTFVEGTAPVPENESDLEPEPEEGFKTAHAFNGLVTDEFGMCGMIQVATAKKSAKGEVKVSGFVMLEDGKKQALKAATGKVSGGAVEVATKVGKTELSLTITDDGFTGTLGDMAVASAEIGEETGIINGTLKMSYFDAKTGKVKTKNITIKGLTNGEATEVSATVKGQGEKMLRAEIVE